MYGDDFFKNTIMRKTAQDLRNDLKKAQGKIVRVNNDINDVLYKLAKNNPKATFNTISNVNVHAQRIVDFWEIIKNHEVDDKLNYIENIEKWLQEQYPYKQLSFFDDVE